MEPKDTRQQILAAARKMVQARGYLALSFRDLAEAVGVKSSSVHYHFPTKGDLGAELARQYTAELEAYLAELLTSDADQSSCIRKYTDVFRQPLINENRMCMCGIMAAEHSDLPVEVRHEVDKFTDANVRWLVEVLRRQQPEADLASTQSRALAIFAAIEGAQLVARGRGDIAVFDHTLDAYRSVGLLP